MLVPNSLLPKVLNNFRQLLLFQSYYCQAYDYSLSTPLMEKENANDVKVSSLFFISCLPVNFSDAGDWYRPLK